MGVSTVTAATSESTKPGTGVGWGLADSPGRNAAEETADCLAPRGVLAGVRTHPTGSHPTTGFARRRRCTSQVPAPVPVPVRCSPVSLHPLVLMAGEASSLPGHIS